jgi:uncharacterized protein
MKRRSAARLRSISANSVRTRHPRITDPGPGRSGPLISRQAALIMVALIGMLIGVLGYRWYTAPPSDPTLPKLTGFVVDNGNVVSPAVETALTEKLASLYKSTGAQVVVLIVPSTGLRDIRAYSAAVGNAWQLGRKNIGDGVLLTVALTQNQLRIDVGCGLEGYFTNADAQAIIDQDMLPLLRVRNFEGALNTGVDAIIARVSGADLPPPGTPTPAEPIWRATAQSPACRA